MKMSSLLLAGVCAAPMLCAQQATMPAVSLKTTAVGGALAGHKVFINGNDEVMCDGVGNVYGLREDSAEKLGRLPIQEITSKGKWGNVFRVPDAILDGVRGVFVDDDGRVYRLVQGAKGSPGKYTDRGYYLLDFAQDGSVKAETKQELEPNRVDIWHLAVFKSGEYLVAGAAVEDSHSPFVHRTPFTAVFAHDGKLLKKIYDPEDEEARQKGEVDWIEGVSQDNSHNFVYAGGVAAGSDGNVYLLRGGYPALVYAISPAGDVIRELRVDSRDPGLIANSIKFYGGRLAIGFDQRVEADALIKVIDLKGNIVANYGVGAGFEASRLACYGPEGFTMVPSVFETKSYLLKARVP